MNKKIFTSTGAALVHIIILAVPLLVLGRIHLLTSDIGIILFFLLVTAWLVIESLLCPGGRGGFLSKTTGNAHKLFPRLIPVLTGGLFLVIFWVSLAEKSFHFFNFGPAALIFISGGCFLFCTGILLRALAIRSLSCYFLDEIGLDKDHRLIQKGIYRLIRHPSETGNILILTGSQMLLSSITGTVLTLFFLFPLIICRTRLEDKILAEHFPGQFPGYLKSTGAFFPFIF